MEALTITNVTPRRLKGMMNLKDVLSCTMQIAVVSLPVLELGTRLLAEAISW